MKGGADNVEVSVWAGCPTGTEKKEKREEVNRATENVHRGLERRIGMTDRERSHVRKGRVAWEEDWKAGAQQKHDPYYVSLIVLNTSLV